MRRSLGFTGLWLAACVSEGGLSSPEVIRSASGHLVIRNPGPSAWLDTNGWQLQPDLVIQPVGDTLAELVDPYALAVDASGRIHVNERRDAHIKVFTSEGRFLRRIGRSGEGPGEFRAMVMTMRNDTIIGHDPRLGRTTLLTADGAYLGSFVAPCCDYRHITAERDGGIVIPGDIGRPELAAQEGVLGARGWLRFDAEGAVMDTLYAPSDLDRPVWHYYEGPQRQHSLSLIPWVPERVRLRLSSGLMLHAVSDTYRLVLSRADTDTIRVIERVARPVEIPDSMRRTVLASRIDRIPELEGVASLGDIPALFPALGVPFSGPDETVWVPVPHAGRPDARFDVFDSTGALLGQVANPLPAARHWVFAGAHLWGIDVTGDAGPAIHRFTVARQRGSGGPAAADS